MPLTTSKTLPTGYNVVTDAEVARSNQAEADSRAQVSALQSSLSSVQTSLTAALERIKALESQPPPVTPPIPPVTSPSARPRLWVDGPVLRTGKGFDAGWRGMELMWGPTSDTNAAKLCANIKAFGANAISPLFQPGQEGIIDVRECLVAAHAAGLMVGVNADHTSGGTGWIKRGDVVAACNEFPGVMLESQVELGSIDSMTQALWVQNAKSFIKGMRDAGHKAPIKVGAPTGGRLPHWALSAGQELVAFDPEHSLIFTWQAYWASNTSAWQFSREAGCVNIGVAGALEMADKIKASGLCFIVGLDGADDIGVTPWKELGQQLHTHGVGWQWWAWFVGDSYSNGVMSDGVGNTGTSPKSPYGAGVRDMLRAQAKLAAL